MIAQAVIQQWRTRAPWATENQAAEIVLEKLVSRLA